MADWGGGYHFPRETASSTKASTDRKAKLLKTINSSDQVQKDHIGVVRYRTL